MKRVLVIALFAAFTLLQPGAGWAFDEIDQTDQKRFRSMKTCSGCHLLQPGTHGVVKMIGARMQGADLRSLDMRNADLRRADLRGVNLGKVNLTGAKLKGALLRGANLRGAILRNANLRGADLTGAKMTGADLRGVNLSRTNLQNAAMEDSNLRGAILCRTTMPSGKVENPDCPWWKQEVVNIPTTLAAKSAPVLAKKAEPNPTEQQPRTAAFDPAAFLGRLFHITVTKPADPQADYN